MQNTLFIDEILREIFHWSAGQDLPRAAQVCRAWKDPALDALYESLTSLKPLLDLLLKFDNGDSQFVTVDQLRTFHSYARRVKYLSHSTITYPGLIPNTLLLSLGQNDLPTYILPRLQTAKVTLPTKTTCSIPPCLSLSPGLRELYLDQGFTSRKVHHRTDDYLKQVALVAPHLESLTFRGLASAEANRYFADMRNLRVLRLRTAHTLDAETLASIATFPQLEILEIHAKEIHSSDLAPLWESSSTVPLFGALQNFWIRCTPDLLEFITSKIESTQLHTLYVDLETLHQTTSFWHTLFDNIRKCFSATLQDLSIMHLLDRDDAFNTDIHDINTIGMKDLRPLSHCHNIRRIDLGTTFPVNVCDADFTHLVKWWPDLESLEFSAEITHDCIPPTPRVTFEALRVISTSLPKLSYLALPVDTSGITEDAIASLDVVGQRVLRTLSIMFPHLPDTTLLPRYLYTLFPDLPEVEYSSEEWFADWVKVTSGVRGLQLKCDKATCT
ncbi:hypothetical protein CPB85DRAFT_1432368 [Mucidula mucida]|nr:hypothetical protein CPB85DRAFT_1432368 [Mucidula mucida]